MEQTLLRELNQKDLQTYLSTRRFEPTYWPGFFPFKSTLFLTFKTIIGSQGRPVMADVVSYNTTAPLKSRKVVDKLTGEIPPIRISRNMQESDLQEYDLLKRLGKTATDTAVFNLIFDDPAFCVDGVNARLEFLAMKALFQQAITLTKDNNAGIITEDAIDFQLDSTHKRVIKSTNSNRTWSTANQSTAKPITDIKVVKAAMKSSGFTLNYIAMPQTKFDDFILIQQVIDFVKPFTVATLIESTTEIPEPSLIEVNKAFRARELPQIIVVDAQVRVETEDHVISSLDPTLDESGTDKQIVFLQERVLGVTYYGPITEESHKAKQVTYAKKGPILVSKYSETNPISECTVAQLNAFPSFPTIDSLYSFDTETTGNADGIAT